MPQICFADSETRSLLDVTVVGAYRYAHHPSTQGIVWGYAFDDDDGAVWSPAWAWGNTVLSHADPLRPETMLEHCRNGGYFVFWNAFFDRWIWNAVMVPKYGWPELPLEQVLCAQAQAEGNNLPGQLGKACEALGTPHTKDPKGKQLIAQLSNGERATWDSQAFETAEKMGHFRAYCTKDVLAMRDLWQCTRPLTMTEWAEYHASEQINDRGVAVDLPFARAAQHYATAEFDDINGQLATLTGDVGLTLSAHLRKARWLHDQLHPDQELQELVEKPMKEDGRPRYSCDRPTREAVLETIMHPEHAERFMESHAERIIQFLELVEAGNSAAVRKFTAIVNQATGDCNLERVHGGYSFNGAGQTGRFSSRGIQVHNIIRAPVSKTDPNRALDAMEDILSGFAPTVLRDTYGYPVSRLLARLIRPTFVAPDGKLLVWGDWDQIEARVLPWLAASPGAERKLDLFRSGQDVYKFAAAPIYGLTDPLSATDEQRQVGKVAELALGFGGAVGAFSAMGRGYGVTVPAAQVRHIVDTWRAANAWCVHFWHELWEAAIQAYRNPGVWHHAGRVKYLFHPDLMRGTLICALPDTRWLVYPQFRHERVEYEDEDTGQVYHRWVTTFVRGFGSGYGRVELWYGMLAENITQATAASILRRTLRKVADVCVLHTHDEIVCEIPQGQLEAFTLALRFFMADHPEAADGLPLTASIESGPYYTK